MGPRRWGELPSPAQDRGLITDINCRLLGSHIHLVYGDSLTRPVQPTECQAFRGPARSSPGQRFSPAPWPNMHVVLSLRRGRTSWAWLPATGPHFVRPVAFLFLSVASEKQCPTPHTTQRSAAGTLRNDVGPNLIMTPVVLCCCGDRPVKTQIFRRVGDGISPTAPNRRVCKTLDPWIERRHLSIHHSDAQVSANKVSHVVELPASQSHRPPVPAGAMYRDIQPAPLPASERCGPHGHDGGGDQQKKPIVEACHDCRRLKIKVRTSPPRCPCTSGRQVHGNVNDVSSATLPVPNVATAT